ncbi:MAG TPA: leucyl aminopeptidase family protein, partial [Hellea balneolensis]|nr:leucyl aminopeptidase family protein [Hellea balneolensis]
MSTYFCKTGDVPDGTTVIPVKICRPEDIDTVLETLTETQTAYAKSTGFKANRGQLLQLPGDDGQVSHIVFGAGSSGYEGSELLAGKLASDLPRGYYRIDRAPEDWRKNLMAICWGLGAYKFTKYLNNDHTPACLVGDMDDDVCNTVAAIHMGRNLINTPAGDLGPVALQDAAKALAKRYGAEFRAIIGGDLLAENLPLIHAVGRAAHQPPRLIELIWGDEKA